jgi:AcrR family transcriptional regulator
VIERQEVPLKSSDKPQGRSKTRRLEVTVASQRRRQIIDAARACIAEEGVEKLTLRKVAERAQVSHATIAYYFHTRSELIDAAFLQIAEEFMRGRRQRRLVYGPQDLTNLVETFLDANNPSHRFVVQMIDAGLRDMRLRGTHDEFVAHGRDRIEKSIRAGIEMGHYRSDIDPKLAAALLHTVLIWWEIELVAGATSRELALSVGRFALKLLEHRPPDNARGRRRTDGAVGVGGNGAQPLLQAAHASPPDLIEASLLNDPRLSPEAAGTLAEAFTRLYWLAARGMPEAITSE